MAYKVILSRKAIDSLDNIITYCENHLQNTQAALSILRDANETKRRLSEVGLNLRKRDDFEMPDIYTIKFKKHKYVMAYKIIDGNVWVLNVYHMSQDIKSKIKEFQNTSNPIQENNE